MLAESVGRPMCWICELPIPMDAEFDSPECFSLDHVVPRADGGALLGYRNLKPAHRLCNALRHIREPGAKMLRRRDELLAQLRQRSALGALLQAAAAGARRQALGDAADDEQRSKRVEAVGSSQQQNRDHTERDRAAENFGTQPRA